MALIHATTRRWTVDEYLRLFEEGILPRERVELVEGEIVRMAAMGPRHKEAIIHSTEVLVVAFRETHRVACQVDVRMGEYSSPEPDFTVIKRDLPTIVALEHADLVIEVSATSLEYDRCEKASLYAKAGIPDYWVLDVLERQLEVHRDPCPDSDAIFGHGYGTIVMYRTDATVSPMCRPDRRLRVEDLL